MQFIETTRINPIYILEFEILISKENVYDQFLAKGEHFPIPCEATMGEQFLFPDEPKVQKNVR